MTNHMIEPFCACPAPTVMPGLRCIACKRVTDVVHLSEEAKEKSRKSDKTLYCVAFVNKRTGRGEMLYTHAKDAGEARLQYFMSEMRNLRQLEMVGVSPVIGYNVQDAKGDMLSV